MTHSPPQHPGAMDTTQLLVNAGATLGVALIGLMAVVPSVMEVRAVRGHLGQPLSAVPAAPTRRPGQRRHRRATPLAF